ncbi:bifunctional diguanylate cyclase/phosphodiesterase [Natronincola ferrireducens]|uniref:Diguanylate cyclase (GGDEF) domain-containing protein n=1 Tax=Natronincola ferrireducens TaxID=393762 RepID=A0A1G8YXU4_9FIRM|nr:EAL domain-containing protein [Natronincola ferrireducens]SDK07648.1 diguanylate cyclase (GGDEF) domain-containing protein [Natronincola ferrireducens]
MFKNPFRSIKQKFLFILIVGISLNILVLVYTCTLITKDIIIDMLHNNNLKHVETYAQVVENWFKERFNEIDIYANTDLIKSMETPKIQSYLQKEMEEKADIYADLFVIEADGTFHSHTGINIDNIGYRDYFSKVMTGERVLSNPIVSTSTGKQIVVVAVPIKNEEEEVLGVMGGSVDLIKLYSLIEGFKGNGSGGYSYIVDSNGVVITHPNKDYIMRRNIYLLSKNASSEIIVGSKETLSREKGRVLYTYGGVESNGYYHVIDNTEGWWIVYKVPTYEAANILNRLLDLVGVATLIILCLGVVLSFYFTHKNTKPIIELKEVFDKAAKGDLSVRAETKYADELGEAGKSFNIMMDKISSLTYYDAITHLPNRDYFIEELTKELAHRIVDEKKLSIVLISINKFKSINDMYGFDEGDEVLKEMGRRIKTIIGEENKVARIGADEFALLFYEVPVRSKILKKVEELLDKITQDITLEGHELHISCRAGIVFFPQDGKDSDTLFKKASIARLRAKQKRQNEYQVYNEEVNKQLTEELTMERNLYHAIENQELYLEFQPFIHIKTGEIVEAEALLRWRHPRKGIIPPGRFIPLAEKTGLIVPIGNWVLREACRQNRAWQDLGLNPIVISVNVSVIQFMRQDFIETIKSILNETKLNPKYLALEITEGVAMEEIEKNIKKFHQLKKLGVKISIDDFGTGFSSLNYFAKFPIDSLKIDRSFIQNIANNQQARAIVSTIISMAQALGVENIAEGVETEEQLSFIKSIGCHKAQGYFFSKPLAAQNLEKLLMENKTYNH